MAVTTAGDEVYVGRQAVLDTGGMLVGYELLHRRRGAGAHAVTSPGAAVAGNATAALVAFGLQHLVADRLAFVGVDRRSLADGVHWSLPAERTVLQVPDDRGADIEFVQLLLQARQAGYRVALGSFEPGGHHPLMAAADLAKIDVRRAPPDQLQRLVRELHALGVGVVATNVETPAHFDEVRRAGADLVQGFFFQRPAVEGGRHVDISQVPAVRLVALLGYQDVSVEELEAVVACDLELARWLLRLAGSAAAGVARPVTSLRIALMLLGRLRIRQLALVAMAHGGAGKMGELTTTALVRAKMCEHLAGALAYGSSFAAFLSGLLSVIDAVFDAPLPALLRQLNVPSDVATAVLDRDGILGALLDTAIAYERGSPGAAPMTGIASGVTLDAYLHGVEWADETVSVLTALGDVPQHAVSP